MEVWGRIFDSFYHRNKQCRDAIDRLETVVIFILYLLTKPLLHLNNKCSDGLDKD
jgi:hypothetical protein